MKTIKDFLLIAKFVGLFICIQVNGSAQDQKRNYTIDDLINVIRLSDKVIVVRTGVSYFEAVTAIVTQKGIVLIDAGNTPQLTEKYKRIIIKEFGRDDFIYLINTHSHRDHTWGNQVFSDVRIIGHERSKEAMIKEWNDQDFYSERLRKEISDGEEQLKQMDVNTDEGKQTYFEITKYQMIQSDFEQVNNHILALPVITFSDKMTLSLGDITVELIYFGNAHSEGDTWVYVPEEKLLFNGDVFFKGGRPNLTYFATEETYGGINEIKRWQNILNYLLNSDRKVDKIVRGHGDIMGIDDLKTFNQQILEIWNEYQKGKEIYPLIRIEKTIENKGIDSAWAEFKKIRTVDKDKYIFIERGFNVVLNRLLEKNNIAEAIELLKMQIDIYPNSSNAYNNLAANYLKIGNKELAIKNYEKSLELNPQNTNAAEQLEKLRGGKL